MTKKRWIVDAGLLAASVCLTLGVLAVLSPRPGVTLANIECIEKGMTLAEVEKILGGPGKRYDSDPLFGHVFYDAWGNEGWQSGPHLIDASRTVFVWGRPHEGTCVAVSFDRESNRVREKNWLPRRPSFFQRLFNSLRL
jgi:hypothetical protein